MKKVLILILAMVLSFSVFALAACQTPCETHVDANHDGICDVCATANLPVVHADSNHDGKCDVCAADYREACADVNPLDGKCDVCGAAVAHTCVDTATVDGKCDICGADVAHTCVDTAPVDGKCDICGADVAHDHIDAEHNGKCDICGTTVEVKHVDNNHDGVCDVCQVGDLPYEHVDEDTNFKCDVCGKVLEHDCVDANTDCWCDVCEAAMHADNNHDGFCDVCDTSTGEPEHVYVEGVCSCGAKEEWLVVLTAAQDYLRAAYIEEPARTAGDFKVLAQVPAGEGFLPVTWTIELVSGGNADSVKVGATEGTETTIEIDEEQMDVYYKLIGTVTDTEGRKLSVSFDRELPNYNLVNWKDYVAAPKDYTLSVQGVVTALTGKSIGNSYNTIYIQDNDGGYYIYDLPSDPVADGIKVGMTIKVRGVKDIYSGTHEVKEAVAEIVDQTIKTVEPADYTTIYTNAQSLKAEDLVAKQGFLVTIKGVQITGQNLDNGYLKFKLGDLESYIRISGSVCPLTKDEQAKFKADHASHFGWTANATGVICVYDGAFYLTPVNANSFEYTALPQLDEAGEVAFEKGALTLVETIVKNSEIELPAKGVSYADVTIAWDFKAETAHDCASISDGKLHVELPAEDTTITLVATLTSGSVSDTKEISIVVKAPTDFDIITFAEAEELAGTTKDKYTEEKYYIMGTIKEVYNATYGNMYIVDDKGNEFTVYGTYDATGANRYDKMENAPVAGDVVVVYGILGYYNAPQMKNGWIVASYDVKTFAEATELAGTTKDKYTEEKHYMIGTIKEVYNTTYGNMYIKDAEGNEFTVYGTYDATGASRYDKMENAPVAGDVVVVYGILGYYNAPQMKNGWIVAVAPAGEGGTDTPVEPPVTDDPAADSVLTIEQALALGASKAHNTYTTGKYYVTGVITEVYNTQYGNMKIADEAGNILTIYGTYDATGANRYDAMATKPVAGDTVKIYGVIGQFNDTPQLKNGWIVEHTPAEGTDTPVEPPVEDETDAVATITFGADTNSKSVSSYTDTWTATVNGYTVTLKNFNNNQNQWAFIKCGRKNNASVGYIETASFTEYKITSIVVTIDAITASKVNSMKLYVYSDSALTQEVEVITVTPATGDLTFEIANPNTDLYYKFAFDCASASSNGLITVSKIAFYGTEPIVDENCTHDALTKVEAKEATCGTVGNKEYYTCTCGKWFEDAAAETEITDKKSVEIAATGAHVDENNDYKCDGCGCVVAPAADSVLTVEQALALGAAHEHNTYTEGKYYVTGVITEVYNTQYGNMKIKDAAGNILTIYGTYSADGSDRYDAMETKPVAGDTVKIYGIVGQFNGTPQLKNGWIVEHTLPHTCESVCEICKKCLNETCTEAACADKCEGHEPAVVLEDVILNVSDLAAGTTVADAELVEGSGIYTTAALSIDANDKSIDGFEFTLRLKLGGKLISSGEIAKGVKLDIKGACTITVYGMASSGTATDRNLILVDSTLTTVGEPQNAPGSQINKLTFAATEAGTYYLGSDNSGINIYYIEINYTAE